MPKIFSDEYFMNEALKEARQAFDKDEVPIGAVVVSDRQIIARAHNSVETLQDVTAHAEMLAITSAFNYLGGKVLTNCTLYVTLEPCMMCAGAIYWARPERLVYGAIDDKAGYIHTRQGMIHPRLEIIKGVMENECVSILKEFFQKKR